jgi:hypothetical protein
MHVLYHVCTIFNTASSAAPPIPLLSENERRMTNLEHIDCLVSISQSILASHLVGGALLLERLLVVLEVAVAPRVRGVQRQHLPGQLQGSTTKYSNSITYYNIRQFNYVLQHTAIQLRTTTYSNSITYYNIRQSITYRYGTVTMCYQTKSHRSRIKEVGKFADLLGGRGGLPSQVTHSMSSPEGMTKHLHLERQTQLH